MKETIQTPEPQSLLSSQESHILLVMVLVFQEGDNPKFKTPAVVRNQESRILLVMGPVFQDGSTATEHTGLGWNKDCS